MVQPQRHVSRSRTKRKPIRRSERHEDFVTTAQRAVLGLQRAAGNQATTALLGAPSVQRDPPPRVSRVDPLADHEYLKQALTPDQYKALSVPGGRLSVPLVQLLPPALSYQTREQMLAAIYPQLASMSGPAPNIKELIAQITESETLRIFLSSKLRSPVSIVSNFDESLSFYLYGMEVQSDRGSMTLSALDRVSIVTVDMIGHEAQRAATQLADLRFLDAMAGYASEHVMPLAMQVAATPADFATAEVQQMGREMTQVASLAEKIGTNLLPGNQDRAGSVAGDLAIIKSVHAFTTAASSVATSFAQNHQVDETGGQTYEEAEDDYAKGAHWSPSGVLSGLNWFATKGFHMVGNALTAGHLDRQASNATAYQTGRISYNAWKENEGWNIAKSLVVAAATALSGGLASRAAAGLFSVEAGYTAVGEATLTGTVVGGAGTASGAVASDAMAEAAALTTSNHYVRDYQNQSVIGPTGWLAAGLGGAMLGGLFGRLFGGGKSSGGTDDLESLRDATKGNEGETPPTGQVAGSAEPVALVNGKQVKPSHYGSVYHGNDLSPSEVQASGGLPAKGNNWDLVNHTEEINARVEGKNDSAFRGATTQMVTPDGERGAVHWGEWVYEIRGMPTWDVNQVLEGQVQTAGGFRGALMSGELENAIPARVPITNIVRYGRVVTVNGRLTVREWHTFGTPGKD